MTAEELAALFHATHERLAPSFGYETRRESAVPWAQVPESNRLLMVAVAAVVLATLREEREALSRLPGLVRELFAVDGGSGVWDAGENLRLRREVNEVLDVLEVPARGSR
jgi:hypothetical protein